LEKVCSIQQHIIDELTVAALAQERAIEELARAAGVDLQQQPARTAPLTSLN
jgi:hypothetical protein